MVESVSPRLRFAYWRQEEEAGGIAWPLSSACTVAIVELSAPNAWSKPIMAEICDEVRPAACAGKAALKNSVAPIIAPAYLDMFMKIAYVNLIN